MRNVLLALLLAFVPLAAQAGEKPMNGAEITAALSGNTAFGNQGGKAWQQYFNANGDTTFIMEGSPPSPGKWEVRGDTFCSLWPPSDKWDCYDMTGAEDNVTWIFQGGGDPWPARMMGGNQLTQ